jgi:MoaA/NifB/PqqE/SkfB family radical SAM enzyme
MYKEDIFKANKDLNEKEIKEGKIILNSKPTILMLSLSPKCNLKCIMCPRPDSDYVLPYEILEKIYYLFPYLELINWTGGEVFLVDYFKKLFLKTSLYPNIHHEITTNGLLIDEEWAEILVNNNVSLTYSIDAVKKETYEYIRNKARYEDLIKSIELINKYKKKYNSKIKLTINVVVMKFNYKELHLFPEFCKKYNFEQLRFEYLRPVINPEQDIFTVRKNPEAIEYLRNIMPYIEDECKRLKIELNSSIRIFLNNNSENLGDHYNFIYNCKLPWKKLLIDAGAMGRITPDCLCPYPLGNIFENTIEEVWNNEVMQLYRKNIINKSSQNWCSSACSIYER